MNKRNLLASLFFGQHGLLPKTFFLNHSRGDRLIVLAYHRVFDLPDQGYPFDEETVSACAEGFEEQITWVSRHFNVMNFHDVETYLKRDGRLPKRALIITFDDGYHDNYEVAFPILKKIGVTAVVFLTTSNVETGQPFWFEKAVYQLKKMEPRRLVLLSGRLPVEVGEKNRAASIRTVLSIFKSIPDEERRRALEELDRQTEIDVPCEEGKLARPLTWEEVYNLSREGIEIGSHTVSHPVLSRLSAARIHQELFESKRSIEERIGKRVISVSYPVGESDCYDESVIRAARACGYMFGISYSQGIAEYSERSRYDLPRVRVERDIGLPLFQANILLPALFLTRKGGSLRETPSTG
ncbi:polysaccharide deacetylase family protein [Candidatus Poribacteria bacterium]|nr:polysaccharide deacetylase family protein [Candidatus Poribacteria bacterium]